ncbi:MAG: hypothetical protein ACI4V5_03920, partial [Prevotella sp.]
KYIFLNLFIMCFATIVNAQYHCTVQSGTENTVTFRATGYGKNVKMAVNDAELNAVRTLIFSGAPGTAYQMPLVATDSGTAEAKHSDAFNELYESAYRNFIESSVTVTAFGKDAEKRKCTTLDIRVRAKSLRIWLENKGVIRKFGL